MSYDAKFNNVLAIWTAFGARGKVVLDMPSLTWTKKYYRDFGYTQYGSETTINVYNNGNAQIAVYAAKTPYMAYWNKSTKQWTIANVSWWSNGPPEILYAADGVFLAKIVGYGNIIASFDGITWYNAGYCTGGKNALTCGAYDVSTKCGVVGWWYYLTPLYYSYDSLQERTAWTLVGSNGNSVPVLKYITTHKGHFIGVVSGDKSISKASSASPGSWSTTIAADTKDTRYMFIRSINNVLFLMKYNYSNSIYDVKLCVMSDDGTQITETNLGWTGDLTSNNVPNPRNILWMADWGKFVLFKEKSMCLSSDGITWEHIDQPGLVTNHAHTFDGAIYVPQDGFYVKGSGYVYYAALQ